MTSYEGHMNTVLQTCEGCLLSESQTNAHTHVCSLLHRNTLTAALPRVRREDQCVSDSSMKGFSQVCSFVFYTILEM